MGVWEFNDGPLVKFIGDVSEDDILTIVFSENEIVRSVNVNVDNIFTNDVDDHNVMISPRQIHCTGIAESNVIIETDGKLSRIQVSENTIPEVDIYRIEKIDSDMPISTWKEWRVVYTVIGDGTESKYQWVVVAPDKSIAKYRSNRQLLSKYSAVKIVDVSNPSNRK